MSAKHPFDEQPHMHDDIARAIFRVATEGAVGFDARCTRESKRWADAAANLADKEARLHEAMPREAANVLQGKNILTFRAMLKEADYKDKELIGDLTTGFRFLATCASRTSSKRGRKTAREEKSAGCGDALSR
jgi:hypothetical protein